MTSITALKGIGDKNAALYGKLGINTVEDAVFYFPRDYITYENISDPSDLKPDVMLAFYATVVNRPLVKRVRRLTITTVMLKAGNIAISATWFNMPYFQKNSMKNF